MDLFKFFFYLMFYLVFLFTFQCWGDKVETGKVIFSNEVIIARSINIGGEVRSNWDGDSSVITNWYESGVLVSAPTITVSSAVGAYIAVELTNDVYLTFSDSFPTNGTSFINMGVYLGAFGLTFDTNVISGSGDLILSTNQWNSIMFHKGFGQTIWTAR